ncbi:MAG: glycosyltransferase family 4 protein [Elainellaceae cyanobacterium]
MKLAIVTHKVTRGDGQGRVNYEVAWEAIRRGYQVTLLASDIAPELEQNSQVNWVPISEKSIPIAFLRNMLFSWKSASWLYRNRSQLDLVKVNGAITSAPSDINAVHFVHTSWLKSPAHVWKQRRDLYGLYQWFYTALNAYWERQAFDRTKTIIAVSNKVTQELIEAGVPPDRIQMIANGVDLQEFHPGKADRYKLGLPEQVSLALFVGDIRTPRKNLDTILKALAQVPELHLAVVGATTGSPYPKLAEKLALKERTHFLGYRQDVPELMRAADFFVFPSRYEACTLVLLEAMASGLPVIAATTTGTAVPVSSDFGILLADPDDTEALVNALKQLSGNRELRLKMGQAARAIAEQYSWDLMAKSYLNLCEKLSKPTSTILVNSDASDL